VHNKEKALLSLIEEQSFSIFCYQPRLLPSGLVIPFRMLNTKKAFFCFAKTGAFHFIALYKQALHGLKMKKPHQLY